MRGPMSEDWNTKYGTRRVRRDPPTLDEAIFAAVGITDDPQAQAEIAASPMGLPIEAVLAEVKTAAPFAAANGPLHVSAGQAARSRPYILKNSFQQVRLKSIIARVVSTGVPMLGFANSACGCGCRSMLPVDSPWRNVRCAPNLWASARIA